ncbi:hypothetical protein AVEN_22784-2 [Araneus ventricosus]|uniref:Peptidase aspartic putative domain-containing protein n=1 Tax=Araneus ventricosus TaxID=182803 RepID=A0A4Y2ED66_ARAVE|nr:hypothetical protein AVEN_22784-2 [Araneus ventricosus]
MVITEYEFRDTLYESEETDGVINREIDSEAYIDQQRVLEIKLNYLEELKMEDCFSVIFEKEEKGQEREVHQDEALVNISKVSAVVLQTLVVIVRGVGVKLIVRSIIDSVSQRSYILKTIAEEMGYQPKKKEHLQHSLFGGSKTSACQHEVFTIYLSNLSEKYNCHFDTLGQPIICDTISSLNLKVYLIESSNQDIQLTDDLVGPIEILIGADVMGKLITENRKQLKFGTDRNRN